MVDQQAAAELVYASRDFASWDLTPSQLGLLELLMNGALSPLRGFMSRRDCDAARSHMRLADGQLWPMPITLEIPEAVADRLSPGDPLALRDPEGVMLAVLYVDDLWCDEHNANERYGRRYCVGGRVDGVSLPTHHDHLAWRLTPTELRAEFDVLGWRRVIAFQTGEIMHRREREATLRAVSDAQAHLLIHATIAPAEAGESQYARQRALQAMLSTYPPGLARLAVLPFGPPSSSTTRTKILQAIVAKNYGCSHLLVRGADELLPHAWEIGITPVPFPQMRYVDGLNKYVASEEVPAGAATSDLSASELEARLDRGMDIPHWFDPPEVAAELRKWHPARHRQGCTIFFTGLSGSGKSTIANVLRANFLEAGGRPVTLLDGDLVRKHLSTELGFSKEHREINIRRIGYVASEITKNGGIAICAPIAPYDQTRKEVRRMIAPLGGFVLVHVSTPLATCEHRDRKGLYAKARAGLVKEFTGISDPYEPPDDADVVIDTTAATPVEAARQVARFLEREGFIEHNQ